MAIEQKTDENPQGQVEEKAITDEAPKSDDADKKESEESLHLCVSSNEKIRIGLTLREKAEREIPNEKLKFQIANTIRNKFLKD